MELNYSYIASSLSTPELLDRISNRQKYMPDSVEAAVKELQFRKHEFTDEELRVIQVDLQVQREDAANFNGRKSIFSSARGVNVIDPDAPLLYSLQSIRVFTILCGALFGSIMMAMNINKLGKGINALWAILFGAVFTGAQIYILSAYTGSGSSGSGAILGGLIASYIIDYVFWRNFIGYATFYRKKPIWIPLIIAIFVFGLLIAAMVYSSSLGALQNPSK